MLKSLLLSAVCAVSLSGCLIVANDGGERTVVQTSASTDSPASLYQAAVADPRRLASEVARDVHPPASSSSCGRSQWYNVAMGATPAPRSWSTRRE